MLLCSKFMVLFLWWNSELTKLYNKVICNQYFHFLCSFQMDTVLGLTSTRVHFLNNLEKGWYSFSLSFIVLMWILKNYICINQRIRQGADMITFWKFINNILRVHDSLNMYTWELSGFQFNFLNSNVQFYLMSFEKEEWVSNGLEGKKVSSLISSIRLAILLDFARQLS